MTPSDTPSNEVVAGESAAPVAAPVPSRLRRVLQSAPMRHVYRLLLAVLVGGGVMYLE